MITRKEAVDLIVRNALQAFIRRREIVSPAQCRAFRTQAENYTINLMLDTILNHGECARFFLGHKSIGFRFDITPRGCRFYQVIQKIHPDLPSKEVFALAKDMEKIDTRDDR